MRLVLARPTGSTADLPSAALLAEAGGISARFPEARLRPCSLVRLPEADGPAHARVWLALESLQVTGSFKVRGALLALSHLAAKGAKAVVAASAGNHGAGVAYAANVLDLDATIVVPRGAPEAKRERIASYGARLVVSKSAGYDDAEKEARELAESMKLRFVSPYDDVAVVAGNGGSLGAEIAKALGHEPAVVIAPFGGGGLATGLACALRSSKVFGAQSEASPAFAQSLERGEAVEHLEAVETLADGLEGGISRAAFERARAVVAGVAVVTEDAIAKSMARAYRTLGVAIEGSAAAAVAPLLEPELPEAMRPPPGGDLVVVLTGRNVDRARLESILVGSA
ncbi:MAG TPA: pyridoxal-phosphate dependent enzyme [Polyangiaceae bacterium]